MSSISQTNEQLTTRLKKSGVIMTHCVIGNLVGTYSGYNRYRQDDKLSMGCNATPF